MVLVVLGEVGGVMEGWMVYVLLFVCFGDVDGGGQV